MIRVLFYAVLMAAMAAYMITPATPVAIPGTAFVIETVDIPTECDDGSRTCWVHFVILSIACEGREGAINELYVSKDRSFHQTVFVQGTTVPIECDPDENMIHV